MKGLPISQYEQVPGHAVKLDLEGYSRKLTAPEVLSVSVNFVSKCPPVLALVGSLWCRYSITNKGQKACGWSTKAARGLCPWKPNNRY